MIETTDKNKYSLIDSLLLANRYQELDKTKILVSSTYLSLTKLNLTMTTPTLYDAFTGIGVPKKKALIGFLRQYSDVAWIKPEGIQKAVEYAVKETPSFGGFIVTVEKDHQILAALIVNKTGMQGYLAEHIIVLNAIMPEYLNSPMMHELLRKAYGVAKGDIAMIVNSYSTKNMELKNINIAAREMKIPLLSKVQ